MLGNFVENSMTSRLVSVLIGIIGIIGTIASIVGVSSAPAQAILLVLFILCLVAALILFLTSKFDVSTAFSILKVCNALGIRRIFLCGKQSVSSQMTQRLMAARTIRIISVSGQALIKAHKSELVKALKNNSAIIKVLIAEPDSEFVMDVEITESKSRRGQISPEIFQVEALLLEYLKEARDDNTQQLQCGRIELGHYTTHLRNSITICDDQWAWFTPNLPPKRSIETVSFELNSKPDGLLVDCLIHFDRVWELAQRAKKVRILT